MSLIYGNCKTCKFTKAIGFNHYLGSEYYCLRFPPSFVGNGYQSGYTPVKGEDGCFEFKPKEEKDKE